MVSQSREMPLVRIEGGPTVRQDLRKQACWSNRHDPILFPMPQEQLLERYLLNLEAPGPALGQDDLQVPSRSLPETFGHRLGNFPSHLWIAKALLICSSKPCCVPGEILFDTFGIGAGHALNQAS